MNDRLVAALIPAFQAEPWIAGVVERTRAQLATVLVVDDGSLDATGQRAALAGAEVRRHSMNSGKGAALRTGFRELLERGVDAVVTLDADGQHVPEQIPRLLGAWRSGADLVLGSRARQFREMAPLRRTSNRLSSRAISFAAGVCFDDVQTGFRLYSRELLERVPIRGDRFDAESGVVVAAARAGFRLVDVPIELARADGRATSHYRPVVDSLRIAVTVIRARLSARRLDAPLAPRPDVGHEASCETAREARETAREACETAREAR
ncbi:MAG TPA: glycosyltransferase family 2 protein [Thermoanaerobaculia bacterium]|nr:glycosyltransferase family 2 protein [Thermoanaerobaculia bacterium]